MDVKKRMSQKEIIKKSGSIPSASVTGESAVPSANKIKGAELAVKASLVSLKKASVPSAQKMESMEEVAEAKGPSSRYKEVIQKRLNKKK